MIDFNSKKNRKIASMIIIVLLVPAMVIPTVAGALVSAGIL